MRGLVLNLLSLSLFHFFAWFSQHWTQTGSETIWRVKYSNCDKGYAVSLPIGVVAHDGLPPRPNHGFVISAAAPDTTSEVTLNSERLVGVYDTHDAVEYGSARAYLKAELEHAEPVEILEHRDTKFRGLPAAFIRYSKGSGKSALETDELIIFRSHPRNSSPIFYVIWLRTPSSHYDEDRKPYQLVRDGFEFIPVPRGECSND